MYCWEVELQRQTSPIPAALSKLGTSQEETPLDYQLKVVLRSHLKLLPQ